MAIDTTKPAWLTNLENDGFCVVPNAIPIEACQEFQENALSWLESFGKGFDRNDVSTWTTEKMPRSFAGLFGCHGVNHEAWLWKIRTQPGIQKAFAQVWGTDDLIVSFDACNISLPVNPKARTDIEVTKPWPHMDQSPRLVHKRQEVQGIANMYQSGPDDGGLVVVRGSHKLHRSYFDHAGKFTEDEEPQQEQKGGQHFEYDELEWYKENGAEIVKVCANEGDLILWDSRTIHWNCTPTGDRTRFASYVAYAPRSFMPAEEVTKKLEVFRQRIPSGHVAAKNPTEEQNKRRMDMDKEDGATVIPVRPKQEPQETKELLWTLGVRE